MGSMAAARHFGRATAPQLAFSDREPIAGPKVEDAALTFHKIPVAPLPLQAAKSRPGKGRRYE